MRLKQLDILRAMAVLMVIGRHYPGLGIWTRAGWTGVDLFFVLSGFLISGLLFAEYKKHGEIRPVHFLIRRGFKIYPGFYVMIGATAVLNLFARHPEPAAKFFSEVFFLQGYLPRVWNHTWSLAVEEHFYLALPLLLMLLCKAHPHARDPFRALPWIFLALAGTVFALRISWVWMAPSADAHESLVTHFYLDGLLFGVLLAYFYHFHGEKFDLILERRRLWFAAACIVLLAPLFVFKFSDRFMETAGHFTTYLGFGLLIAVVLPPPGAREQGVPGPLRHLGSKLAAIGTYSYSIYLWHMPMAWWVTLFLRHRHLIPPSALLPFWLYLPVSLVPGIVMARLVEVPALVLRDRMFPSRSANPVLDLSEAVNNRNGSIAASA
jgi:peptidoglycan/LPS O-acetylase OafA/YrhL